MGDRVTTFLERHSTRCREEAHAEHRTIHTMSGKPMSSSSGATRSVEDGLLMRSQGHSKVDEFL